MLIQIGLEDIVNFPSREQIAYLLVERARLLDELDEAHEVFEKTVTVHTVNGSSEVTIAYSCTMLFNYYHTNTRNHEYVYSSQCYRDIDPEEVLI